jgi:hypothetical protein
MLTTVKRLLNAPHREHIAAAAARENEAMAELIGTGANARCAHVVPAALTDNAALLR